LAQNKKWKVGSDAYKDAKRAFDDAFDRAYNSAVDRFFKRYAGFDYNPRANSKTELERLKRVRGWTDKNLKFDDKTKKRVKPALYANYSAAMDAFFEAFAEVFGSHYDGSSYSWEELCRDLKIDPVPATTEECREVG
jgi:hypothetical protein